MLLGWGGLCANCLGDSSTQLEAAGALSGCAAGAIRKHLHSLLYDKAREALSAAGMD